MTAMNRFVPPVPLSAWAVKLTNAMQRAPRSSSLSSVHMDVRVANVPALPASQLAAENPAGMMGAEEVAGVALAVAGE